MAIEDGINAEAPTDSIPSTWFKYSTWLFLRCLGFVLIHRRSLAESKSPSLSLTEFKLIGKLITFGVRGATKQIKT